MGCAVACGVLVSLPKFPNEGMAPIVGLGGGGAAAVTGFGADAGCGVLAGCGAAWVAGAEACTFCTCCTSCVGASVSRHSFTNANSTVSRLFFAVR